MSNEPLTLDHFAEVNVKGARYEMCEHWFWPEFNRGEWEPSTWEIFKKYLKPERAFLDIGTWVGPSILYAAEMGAQRIYGIEAHPGTYQHINASVARNPKLASIVKLISNFCVTDQTGNKVLFGSGCYLSSASSIKQSGYNVPTTTLRDWIKTNNIQDIGLISIDIEGADALLEKDMAYFATLPDLAILFSPHPSLWAQKRESARRVSKFLEAFTVLDNNQEPISRKELAKRFVTDEKFPTWGTQHGNFFELLLLSNGS